MTTKQLQERIQNYDDKHYFPDKPLDWRMHHALGHLNKTLGLLAQYLDDVDHGREPSTEELKEKVVPDLLQYALRLSNMLDVDLETQFIKRQNAIEESKK